MDTPSLAQPVSDSSLPCPDPSRFDRVVKTNRWKWTKDEPLFADSSSPIGGLMLAVAFVIVVVLGALLR